MEWHNHVQLLRLAIEPRSMTQNGLVDPLDMDSVSQTPKAKDLFITSAFSKSIKLYLV